MRVYLDNLQWERKLSEIPIPLRNKRIIELQLAWQTEFGIQFLANGPLWMAVSITGSNRRGVQQFLESCGACAVDIEPADIRTLLDGRRNDPTVLALVHGSLEPEVRQQLSGLEPHEIFGVLEQLLWSAVAPGEITPLNGIDEAVAVQRMRDAGIEVPDVAFDAVPLSEHQQRAAEMPLEPGDLGEDVSTDDLISAVERAGLEEYL